MPMNFPDFDSLKRMGEMLCFRKPNEGAREQEDRNALADFDPDPIESQEIRTGKGWDKWNEAENLVALITAINRLRS